MNINKTISEKINIFCKKFNITRFDKIIYLICELSIIACVYFKFNIFQIVDIDKYKFGVLIVFIIWIISAMVILFSLISKDNYRRINKLENEYYFNYLYEYYVYKSIGTKKSAYIGIGDHFQKYNEWKEYIKKRLQSNCLTIIGRIIITI